MSGASPGSWAPRRRISHRPGVIRNLPDHRRRRPQAVGFMAGDARRPAANVGLTEHRRSSCVRPRLWAASGSTVAKVVLNELRLGTFLGVTAGPGLRNHRHAIAKSHPEASRSGSQCSWRCDSPAPFATSVGGALGPMRFTGLKKGIPPSRAGLSSPLFNDFRHIRILLSQRCSTSPPRWPEMADASNLAELVRSEGHHPGNNAGPPSAC